MAIATDVVKLLEEVSGLVARDYSTYDHGRSRDPRAISVAVPEASARALVRRLRERLPARHTAFSGTRTSPRVGVFECEVVVVMVRDQFDVVRYARTSAENHQLDTGAIIAKLEDWDERFGIEIVVANSDSIELEFPSQPTPLLEFAAEVLELCPACESVDSVMRLVRAGSTLLLWWD